MKSALAPILWLFFSACAPTAEQLQAEQEESINSSLPRGSSAETIGEIAQAVGPHTLSITRSQVAPQGWGIFGTGNPGPDADGCQRNPLRVDCIRVFSGSCAADANNCFGNELAYPNAIAGDSNNATTTISIDQYTDCAHVPNTIDALIVTAAVYSSPGVQGGINYIKITGDHLPGSNWLGPTSSNSAQFVSTTFTTTSSGGAIPKSAICGDASQRYNFLIMTSSPFWFPNWQTDGADWIALGAVQIQVGYF